MNIKNFHHKISKNNTIYYINNNNHNKKLFLFIQKKSMIDFDPKKDYYTLLGLKDTANEKEIKSAYYTLAKKYHPDLNEGKHSTDFKEMTNAYELLSNSTKKSEYDILRKTKMNNDNNINGFGFNDNYYNNFWNSRDRDTSGYSQKQNSFYDYINNKDTFDGANFNSNNSNSHNYFRNRQRFKSTPKTRFEYKDPITGEWKSFDPEDKMKKNRGFNNNNYGFNQDFEDFLDKINKNFDNKGNKEHYKYNNYNDYNSEANRQYSNSKDYFKNHRENYQNSNKKTDNDNNNYTKGQNPYNYYSNINKNNKNHYNEYDSIYNEFNYSQDEVMFYLFVKKLFLFIGICISIYLIINYNRINYEYNFKKMNEYSHKIGPTYSTYPSPVGNYSQGVIIPNRDAPGKEYEIYDNSVKISKRI
jgi:curved DNA-binding protein CbpA